MVNSIPLLLTPFTVTVTGPVSAAAGTVASMAVAVHQVGATGVLLKVAVLLPWMSPKFLPMIVTGSPVAPLAADRLTILGVVSMVGFSFRGRPAWFSSHIRVVGSRTCQVSITVTSMGRCCAALISSAIDR